MVLVTHNAWQTCAASLPHGHSYVFRASTISTPYALERLCGQGLQGRHGRTSLHTMQWPSHYLLPQQALIFRSIRLSFAYALLRVGLRPFNANGCKGLPLGVGGPDPSENPFSTRETGACRHPQRMGCAGPPGEPPLTSLPASTGETGSNNRTRRE